MDLVLVVTGSCEIVELCTGKICKAADHFTRFFSCDDKNGSNGGCKTKIWAQASVRDFDACAVFAQIII